MPGVAHRPHRGSVDPDAVFLDDLAVQLDAAAGAQVLDDVPVDGGRVRTPRYSKPSPSATWTVPFILSSKKAELCNHAQTRIPPMSLLP
jgi:hypothetical protein